MPNNRGLTKEDVVYIHSIILLGKKICNLQRCRPRNCHTEWSKSEKEKQILSINTYMWTLENKMERWSYLQSRSRDMNEENKYGYQGGRVVGWNGRLWLTYTHYYV